MHAMRDFPDGQLRTAYQNNGFQGKGGAEPFRECFSDIPSSFKNTETQGGGMGIRLKVGVRGPPLRPLSKQASMQIADRVPLHRTHSPISPLPTGSRRDRPYVRVSSGGESVVSTRPLHHTGVSVCAGGGGGGGRGAGRDHGRWLRWVAGLGWGGPGAWLTTAAAGAAVVGRGPRPRRPTRGSWLAAWRVGRLALSGCRRRARRRPGAPGRPPRSGVADVARGLPPFSAARATQHQSQPRLDPGRARMHGCGHVHDTRAA